MSIRKIVVSVALIAFAVSAAGATGHMESPSGDLSFSGVPVPTTDAQKRTVLASEQVLVNGRAYEIGYNVLLRSGDSVGGNTFAQIFDENGRPVVESDGSPFISNDNDFSSLLPVGDSLYMVSHFESRPGAMYLTELSQNPNTGALTAVSTENIDFSDWGGLWVPCAGSVTPWNTHLGSEEYEPDARMVEEAATPDEIDDYYKPMMRYTGIRDPFDASVTADEMRAAFNPYLYGHPTEITVYSDGSYRVDKHYAMPRAAIELAYVMPDQRTVYISDDGTNVGLFMFVADIAGDLSAGTLYAAKWIQTSDENGGTADIEWVDLGWARGDQIREIAESGVQFSDIFEVMEPVAGEQPPAGFRSVNHTYGHEWLKVRPGMEIAASRLESRRYAAYMGATTEWRKMEGITYNPDMDVLYIAMSEIASGMENFMRGGSPRDSYDIGGPNDIRLPYNSAGTVYALTMDGNSMIGSDFVASDMYGVVSGRMIEYPESSPYAGNKNDVEGIANPDNITYIPGYDTLIIGEDTGSGHQNDMIWAFNTRTEELTRIQTTPYGSETTSPYFYPDINGFSYIMSVIQHPYGESDEDMLMDPADARAYVGYIGPMPALNAPAARAMVAATR